MYTVFPTGTTIYNPEKCYDGYTLYLSKTLGVGAVLVDMNGDGEVDQSPRNLLGGQIGRVSKVYDHNWRAEDVVQETWDGQGE